MEQVKMFRGCAADVEQLINKWLKEKPVKITRVLQSEHQGWISITIFYVTVLHRKLLTEKI